MTEVTSSPRSTRSGASRRAMRPWPPKTMTRDMLSPYASPSASARALCAVDDECLRVSWQIAHRDRLARGDVRVAVRVHRRSEEVALERVFDAGRCRERHPVAVHRGRRRLPVLVDVRPRHGYPGEAEDADHEVRQHGEGEDAESDAHQATAELSSLRRLIAQQALARSDPTQRTVGCTPGDRHREETENREPGEEDHDIAVRCREVHQPDESVEEVQRPSSFSIVTATACGSSRR